MKVKDPAILEQAREIHEVNAEAMAEKNQLSELDILSLLNNDSTYTQVSGWMMTCDGLAV